ncbi:hypothetical protein RFI_26161 [Reticulomyxa filosa]|uniref:Casein kinase II subunit beta n=1 Tax=Reticulomyxa filosa TaxID=46433 RepID=X6MC12_RETFI|nr:hypothetical protein RFI_26161 [Reticulomyxa filosa]|eukprot:ETO11216.1 hypothetical protein RFI_26161 [Reticulomyxa filosa]
MGLLADIDGAYFGTTFAHLFFLVFPELKPEKSKEHYKPRVFGFDLHSTWHQKSLEAARRAQYEYQQEKRRLEGKSVINGEDRGGGNNNVNDNNPPANSHKNGNGNNSNSSDHAATTPLVETPMPTKGD